MKKAWKEIFKCFEFIVGIVSVLIGGIAIFFGVFVGVKETGFYISNVVVICIGGFMFWAGIRMIIRLIKLGKYQEEKKEEQKESSIG